MYRRGRYRRRSTFGDKLNFFLSIILICIVLPVFITTFLGRREVEDLLFEQPEKGYFTGHAPNYVKVYVQAENLHNQVYSVTVTELYQDGVLGQLAAL